VEILIDATLELNVMEIRYFALMTKQRIQKTTGLSPMKMNNDWPAMKMLEDGTWPPNNPNWFKQ